MTRTARLERRHEGNGWYRIVNTGTGPAQILIYDEIGFWGVTAQDFLHELGAINGPVEVRINSPGGDVFDAYAIYNALASRPDVTTVVDSLAASSASVIAMAGEQRLMARTSQLMIHDAWAVSDGNADDLRHMAGRLDTVSGQIAAIYADTAGGDPEHWRELMRSETWFTPEQALEAGLITGVVGAGRDVAPAAASGRAPAGAVQGSAREGDVTTSLSDSSHAQRNDPEHEPSDSLPGASGSGNHAAQAATIERTNEMPNEPGALTIEARRTRINDINGELREIAAAYPASELPTDQQAAWDQLVAERSDHQRALDSVERRNADLAQGLANGVAPGGVDRPLDGDGRPRQEGQRGQRPVAAGAGPAFHARGDIYDLAAIRQQAHNTDELPGLYRDNAMRAIEQHRFPGSDRETAQANVARLLDTIPDDTTGELARRILATGSPAYTRAFGRALQAGNPGALGGHDGPILALGLDDSGAFAVPFQLDPTIVLSSDGVINPLRQMSRVVQITGKEYDLVTSQGVTVHRVAERTEASNDAPTLAQPSVKAERVQGFIPFSVELEGDWTGLQAEMMRLLTEAKDVEEAEAFTLGTGTGTDASGVVSTLPASRHVATGGTAAFAVEDVYKVKNATPPRFRKRGQFLAESSIYDLVRQFGSGTMANVWTDLGGDRPPQLIGYPARESSEMASTVTSGNLILQFGDFQQFLIVDRVGMSVEFVPHLLGTNRRPTGERGYYAYWRNNAVILVDNAFRALAVA